MEGLDADAKQTVLGEKERESVLKEFLSED